MPMNYGWSNTTPKCIKFFHIAHQKATIFKTTFHMVSGQNLGRDPTAYSAKCIKYIYNIYTPYPSIYIYICNIYIVWTQATTPTPSPHPTPFSYLIFSRLIIFTFRNYFILYKIVWYISENILEYRVPKFA